MIGYTSDINNRGRWSRCRESMLNNIEVGQAIKCIDIDDCDGLTIGNYYTIIDFEIEGDDISIAVKNDYDFIGGYCHWIYKSIRR